MQLFLNARCKWSLNGHYAQGIMSEKVVLMPIETEREALPDELFVCKRWARFERDRIICFLHIRCSVAWIHHYYNGPLHLPWINVNLLDVCCSGRQKCPLLAIPKGQGAWNLIIFSFSISWDFTVTCELWSIQMIVANQWCKPSVAWSRLGSRDLKS